MPETPYASVHLSDIPSHREREPGSPEWKPLRHHFGIRGFGVNAMVASNAGDRLVNEHHELPTPGEVEQRHEELYLVLNGRATFTVDGEDIDAPAGMLVFVRDPAAVRSAVAREAGTTVLAVGAEPGVPFEVSPWERERFGG